MITRYPKNFVGLFDTYVRAYPDAPSLMVVDMRLHRVYFGMSPQITPGTFPEGETLDSVECSHGLVGEFLHNRGGTARLMEPLQELGPSDKDGARTRLFYFDNGPIAGVDMDGLQTGMLASSLSGGHPASGVELYAVMFQKTSKSKAGTIEIGRFRDYLATVDEARKTSFLHHPVTGTGYGADRFNLFIMGSAAALSKAGIDMERLPSEQKEMECGLLHDYYGFEGYTATSPRDHKHLFGNREIK